MHPQIPVYVSATFVLTTVLTLWLFFRALRTANRPLADKVLLGLLVWLLVQAVLSGQGVYASHPEALPPRVVVLGILPAVVVVLGLFFTEAGRRLLDQLPLRQLTLLSVVRVPVEIVLYWLTACQTVPELMTFAGRNFDILAGLTAPLVAYWGFLKGQTNRRLLLIWNVASLGLLANIVVNALLSAPSPFQQFAFDQPNVAILYFPISWLPTFVVPIVLLSHLTALRQLLQQ
jgi:hypothetical protein